MIQRAFELDHAIVDLEDRPKYLLELDGFSSLLLLENLKKRILIRTSNLVDPDPMFGGVTILHDHIEIERLDKQGEDLTADTTSKSSAYPESKIVAVLFNQKKIDLMRLPNLELINTLNAENLL